MLFIMCHFLVKAIVFFELGKAISFSILFIFRISAIRVFIFKSFFSLDLYTFNININKMLLLKHLLFSKMKSLCNQETQKRQSMVFTLVYTPWDRWTSYDVIKHPMITTDVILK